MKKVFILLLVIPLLSFQNSQIPKEFIGSWKGEDKGEVGSIIFDANGYATFVIDGQKIGGKEFVLSGKKGNMTYTINSKVSPIQIDFKITKLESGESKRILAIAEFFDNNTLKVAINLDKDRPINFEGDNAII